MHLLIEIGYEGFRSVKGPTATPEERAEAQAFVNALTKEIAMLGIAARGYAQFREDELVRTTEQRRLMEDAQKV